MHRLTIALLLGMTLPAAAQPAREPAANVTLVAKVVGIGTVQINQETQGLLTLELGKDATVLASVPKKVVDELQAGAGKRRASLEKRAEALEKEYDKLSAEFIDEKDKEKSKKIEARLNEVLDELSENTKELTSALLGIGAVVIAEGTLTIRDGQLRLQGTAKPRDPDQGKDKPVGTVEVVGELRAGEFKAGDLAAKYAIRKETTPILLTGKGTDTAAELRGSVRAVGKLTMTDKKAVVLEAVRVASVKK